MKIIQISKGYSTQVSDHRYDYLMQWKWSYHKCGYAVRVARINGKPISILMHRDIMKPGSGEHIDHIDHNRLNNQDENLRLCTTAENGYNQRIRTGGTSKYKGVYWSRDNKKWCAEIRVNYQKNHLGYFRDELDAALAYDQAARIHFGEFAHTNFKESLNG